MYAIWLIDVYDFSVSQLSVSPNEVFKNETVTISVRADNWDRDDAYNNIVVQFYIDGTLKWVVQDGYIEWGEPHEI